MKKILLVVLCAGFLEIAACAGAPEKPAMPVSEAVRSNSRTAFLRDLYSTNRATYGDAVRMIHALVTGGTSTAPFAELHQELVKRGIAREEWGPSEGEKVSRGRFAYLLVSALQISGGVTMNLFGLSERHALREATYHRLMVGTFSDEYLTGRELIDTLRRAEIFRKEGNLDSIRKQS